MTTTGPVIDALEASHPTPEWAAKNGPVMWEVDVDGHAFRALWADVATIRQQHPGRVPVRTTVDVGVQEWQSLSGVDGVPMGVALDVAGDAPILSAPNARRVAAALLEAAELVERITADGAGTASDPEVDRSHRNLIANVTALLERHEATAGDLATFAEVFGVSAASLLRDPE